MIAIKNLKVKSSIFACLLLLSLNLTAIEFTQAPPSPDLQKDWPTIIAQLEAALNQSPSDQGIISSLANSYNNYGLTLASNKQWSQAEYYVQKGLALVPDSDSMKRNLSNIYFGQAYESYQDQNNQSYESNEHGEAQQLAKKALSIYPKNVNAYLLLGDIEYMNQDMTAAKDAWQQASTLMPDNQQIKERLEKIIREGQTENAMTDRFNSFFIIKIDPDLAAIPNFDINQSLDTARYGVDGDFNFKPTHKIPVIVYTLDEYRQTLNGAPIWSEGAYDGKIRVILNPDVQKFDRVNSTIVHEYTHAVVGDLTKNTCPRWFNEGIAKYEEYRHGVAPLINILATASTNNSVVDWAIIDQAIVSVNKNEALLAYQQSFTFIYHLIEQYGKEKLIQVLTSLGNKQTFEDAIQTAYGSSIDDLQKNWRTWLTGYVNTWAEQSSQGMPATQDPLGGGLFYSN
jgi:tetratricopeptide (TPR) repeat protein